MKRIATQKEIEVFNEHLKQMNYHLNTRCHYKDDGTHKTDIILLVEEPEKVEAEKVEEVK